MNKVRHFYENVVQNITLTAVVINDFLSFENYCLREKNPKILLLHQCTKTPRPRLLTAGFGCVPCVLEKDEAVKVGCFKPTALVTDRFLLPDWFILTSSLHKL